MSNPLEQLQADMVAYLLGNTETAAVPFSAFRRMVVESVADEAAAAWRVREEGKVGLAALVLMPEVVVKYQNVPGPQYGVEIRVRLFEDPTANNTGLTSEAAAMSVLRFCDGLIIEDLTGLYASTENGSALRPNYDFPGFLVYDVVFGGELPQDLVVRTVDPTITDDNAGMVYLACTDATAVIYYSLGGEAVQPGSAAQLYSNSFLVDSGAVVRAVALAPNRLPSNLVQGVVTF